MSFLGCDCRIHPFRRCKRRLSRGRLVYSGKSTQPWHAIPSDTGRRQKLSSHDQSRPHSLDFVRNHNGNAEEDKYRLTRRFKRFLPKMPPIAIIGGGPSSLTFARLLGLKNIDHVVFERNVSSFPSQGDSLDIHATTGQLALKQANLKQEFERFARRGTQVLIFDKNGQQLLAFEERDAPEIDRGKLCRILFGLHSCRKDPGQDSHCCEKRGQSGDILCRWHHSDWVQLGGRDRWSLESSAVVSKLPSPNCHIMIGSGHSCEARLLRKALPRSENLHPQSFPQERLFQSRRRCPSGSGFMQTHGGAANEPWILSDLCSSPGIGELHE